MIRITKLSHRLGKNEVLSSVDLTVPDSTVLGLVGVNGAGKSTLLRLLAGVYIADSGSIDYDGSSPAKADTRADLFFLPDDPYYTHTDTPKSTIGFYRVFYPGFDESLCLELLGSFGLDVRAPLRTMSKGMRRTVYIAIALAANTKYLLLDEAFDGLDPLARRRIKTELVRAVEERGASVVISSHSLGELENFCDRFAILDGRRIASSGNIAEWVEHYCKFMLAFAEPAPESIFEGLPTVSVERSGKFIKAVFAGRAEDIEPRLLALSPAVIEEQAVDFEEVFVSEVSSDGGTL